MDLDDGNPATPAKGSDEGPNHHHEIHALPPTFIQKQHWHYVNVKKNELDTDDRIVDFAKGLSKAQREVVKPVDTLPASTVEAACSAYKEAYLKSQEPVEDVQEVTVYEHTEFPGLRILPGLLPPEIQVLYVSQILHRDLAIPSHKNNLQADYNIPYPTPVPHPIPANPSEKRSEEYLQRLQCPSFFTFPQNSQRSPQLIPKSPSTHKPLNIPQFLSSKLRWLTIGDQYDWPTRSYTRGGPSSFPTDLASLVTALFPQIHPQSGVVLLYSAKDYMPVHRDVSEECETPLASFSLGCDGIFLLARGEDGGEGHCEPKTLALRVRSGDCLFLSGEARWAWHAMARTVSGSCPPFLAEWPKGTPGASAEEGRRFEKWKGYMSGKRVNVSCRQVWD